LSRTESLPSRPTAASVFAALGHFYVHFFIAIYFVIVLSLEQVWQQPYHELIALWTVGSLLVGAAALPAGMLADRFGAARVMIIYFLGLGSSSVAAGLVGSPRALLVALSSIGLFAAVYHPVGIPWLVRNARGGRGRALGINGVFGSLGTAASAIVAGVLIDLWSWRAAFIVPGVVCALTGLVMLRAVHAGRVEDRPVQPATHDPEVQRSAMVGFALLVLTMFLAGLIYHAVQTAIPKVFALRFRHDAGGAASIGLLVAVVYAGAGLVQVVGGFLADRFPLKAVYVGAILVQIPTLWWIATWTGVPLIATSTLTVIAGAAALPAENLLLSRYTPAHRHGLAFGFKYVLAFGAAPIAVQLVARLSEHFGNVFVVFTVLAGLSSAALLAAVALPSTRQRSIAVQEVSRA
jgi:MFS transporter, FSR family, fosmidomycin resistance protein